MGVGLDRDHRNQAEARRMKHFGKIAGIIFIMHFALDALVALGAALWLLL